MNRILGFSIFTLSFLISCAGNTIYSELFNNLQVLLSGPEDISNEKINSVPYASIQVSLGRGKNALLVLEEEKNGLLKWTSSNLVKIYTKKGLILKLSGLENDLVYIDLDNDHPINKANFILEKKVLTSFYTFKNPNLFRLPVKTKINYLRDEELSILGKIYKTKLYEEVTLKNLISWNFKNLYWVNEEGEIIKSVQNVTPKNPVIHLKVTKKYENLAN